MGDFLDVNAKLENIIRDYKNEELFKEFLEEKTREGWRYFDLYYNFEISSNGKELYYNIELPLIPMQETFTICKDIPEENLTNIAQSVDTLLEWLKYDMHLKAELVTDGSDDLDIFDSDHNIKKRDRKIKNGDILATGFVYNIYLD